MLERVVDGGLRKSLGPLLGHLAGHRADGRVDDTRCDQRAGEPGCCQKNAPQARRPDCKQLSVRLFAKLGRLDLAADTLRPDLRPMCVAFEPDLDLLAAILALSFHAEAGVGHG